MSTYGSEVMFRASMKVKPIWVLGSVFLAIRWLQLSNFHEGLKKNWAFTGISRLP